MRTDTIQMELHRLFTEFIGNQEDFLVKQDLLKDFTPKKFKFKTIFVTQFPIFQPSHRNLLIKSMISMEKDLLGTDFDLKHHNQILVKCLTEKNKQFWTVFSQYNALVSCAIFHIQEPLGIKILPTVGFPILIKIVIQEIPLCSLESFAWIDAPQLVDIRILRCHLTRVNGLDKAKFPNLLRIFLVENHIMELQKMSRIHLSNFESLFDLRFVIRDKFTEFGQAGGDETFYNRQETFASLEEFNNLNFIAKMETRNFTQHWVRIMDSYSEVLSQLYMFHTLQGRERSQDQVRAFWRNRPLVWFSFLSLAKRFDSKLYQDSNKFINAISQIVYDRCGPENEWN